MKNCKLAGLIFILLLSCIACHKKQLQEKPANLITYNKMVNLIVEAYLIESNIYMAPDTIDQSEMCKTLYSEMFYHYGITKEEFVTSIEYYLGDEDQANIMMQEASERLSEKRKDFFADKITEEKSNLDSINNIIPVKKIIRR